METETNSSSGPPFTARQRVRTQRPRAAAEQVRKPALFDRLRARSAVVNCAFFVALRFQFLLGRLGNSRGEPWAGLAGANAPSV